MRYSDAQSFRAAIEARLRSDLEASQNLARRRRTIAFDRFLARLAVSESETWVLKGGAALEFRMPGRARTTRDIDLAVQTGARPLEALLELIADDPFSDFFGFRITRRKQLGVQPDREPVLRPSVEATLAARVFERFVVDIVETYSDSVSTELVPLGSALAFAELPAVEIATLDLRTHFAEKLSAYLRRYDDRPNTRVKDLIDLVLLIEHGLTPDAQLRSAVEATFESRQQDLPTAAMPSMAAMWQEPYSDMAAEVGLGAATSNDAHQLVEEFWRQALANC